LFEECIEPQLVIQLAGQPAAAPLPGPAQFHLIEPNPDDRLLMLLDRSLRGHQRQGARD
jgi:hypothetical protein